MAFAAEQTTARGRHFTADRGQWKTFIIETQSWDEYWRGVFPRIPTRIRRLQQAWNNHRQNRFHKESGQVFGAAYMDAVREALKGHWSKDAQKRLLSLENTVICRMDATQPLAAMTTNFRNPVLLLRQSDSKVGSRYNQTLLLPLMTAGDGEVMKVFFHYRRQSLLRNTDDGLFFFPCVDLSVRGDSFGILQELVEVLVNEWDSRIEQRVNLLSDKVILPLCPA